MGVDAEAAFDGLMEREAASSTGVGQASPCLTPGCRVWIGCGQCFVRLETPVAFGAVDDKPVDLLVALFAPPEANS
ncbi:transcriptional regulator, partial [Caulobacter sp. B11]